MHMRVRVCTRVPVSLSACAWTGSRCWPTLLFALCADGRPALSLQVALHAAGRNPTLRDRRGCKRQGTRLHKPRFTRRALRGAPSVFGGLSFFCLTLETINEHNRVCGLGRLLKDAHSDAGAGTPQRTHTCREGQTETERQTVHRLLSFGGVLLSSISKTYCTVSLLLCSGLANFTSSRLDSSQSPDGHRLGRRWAKKLHPHTTASSPFTLPGRSAGRARRQTRRRAGSVPAASSCGTRCLAAPTRSGRQSWRCT